LTTEDKGEMNMARNEIHICDMEFTFGRDKQSIATAYVFQNFCRAAQNRCAVEVANRDSILDAKLKAVEKTFKAQVAQYMKAHDALVGLGKKLQEEASAQGYTFEGVVTGRRHYKDDDPKLCVAYDNRHNRGDGSIFKAKYLPLVVELYETLVLTEFTDLKPILEKFTTKLNAL